MGENLCTSHNRRSDKFGNSEVGNSEPCPLCGDAAPLEQDHDHRTDLCRGRICHPCNVLLARFDRPTADIQRFIDYLQHWERQHATAGAQTYTEYMREAVPSYKRGRRAPRPRKSAA